MILQSSIEHIVGHAVCIAHCAKLIKLFQRNFENN